MNNYLDRFKCLHPYYVTGFCDAESSFSISISKQLTSMTGWNVNLTFKIGLQKKDKALLEFIQGFFGGIGRISVDGNAAFQYRVQSIKELAIIIDHFVKYPLITQKYADFLLFKQAFELMKHKEHLTELGLKKLINIKASINLGLSSELKAAFPDIITIPKLKIQVPKTLDPYWVVGFTDGDGCFLVHVQNSSKSKLGKTVRLRFQIVQHSRDAELIKSLKNYFNCGEYISEVVREVGYFRVEKFSDTKDKIIPFFQKYSLQGIKNLDFMDFVKVSELMKIKAHLTPEGLNQILEIKSNMNTGRIHNDHCD